MIKDVVKFKNELEKVNGWWIFDKVKDIERKNLIKRKELGLVEGELGYRRAVIISGPRRVGKTILLKQVIQNLLTRGTDKRNILYYSMDDPTLFTLSDNLIKDIIDYFLENIAKPGKKYILLDEAHLYKDWYKWIKSYYDRNEEIKFILSGSSSFILQRDANKYLRGRTISIEMLPLSFGEFLLLSDKKTDLKIEFDKIFNLRLDHFKLKKIEKELKPYFLEYLLVGGFPEWFEIKDHDKWFLRIKEDVPKKAIYEDIENLFTIKNPKILEQILLFIVANQSKILSYEKINEVAGLDRNTLINYIEYLKSTYLVIEFLKYAKNVKEQLKSMKKYICIDQGLRNAILKEYEITEDNSGFVIENIVGLHLFRLSKKYNDRIFYFRAKKEVDFVLKNKKLVPIEVKYAESINKSDIANLLNFMSENKLKEGIVVTKNLFKTDIIERKKILFIPAWLFLSLE